MDDFRRTAHIIEDEVIRKRVAHVIAEDDRVLKSVEALEKGDIALFGQYLTASHNSLRELYEVTGFELDTLAAEALTIKGAAGSRMTGAGFGGCTVSIVKDTAVDSFIEIVGKNYKEKTGLTAAFYVPNVVGGAKELE